MEENHVQNDRSYRCLDADGRGRASALGERRRAQSRGRELSSPVDRVQRAASLAPSRLLLWPALWGAAPLLGTALWLLRQSVRIPLRLLRPAVLSRDSSGNRPVRLPILLIAQA